MLQSIFKQLLKLNSVSAHSVTARAAKRKTRYLTDGEIKLARSVFGDSLKLDDIQLRTAWWVLKHYAVSPNGSIYFHPADWIEDFSQAPLGKQSWLIHELTHVWQLQQGLKVVRGALISRRCRQAGQAPRFLAGHRPRNFLPADLRAGGGSLPSPSLPFSAF